MVMKSAVKSAQTAASFIAHPAESSGTADAVGGFVSVRVGSNVSLVGLRTTRLNNQRRRGVPNISSYLVKRDLGDE
jgi:hypothetical protein